MPRSDRKYLATLGSLYEVINIAVRHVMQGDPKELKVASRLRLPEKRIDFYYDQAVKFFEELSRVDPLLGKYFRSDAPSEVLIEAREPEKAHLLFRPIGLLMVAKVLAELRKNQSRTEAFRRVQELPIELASTSYAGIIWDTDRATMIMKGANLCQKLLVHMLGGHVNQKKLRETYASWRKEPVDRIRLPNRLF